MKRGKQGKKSPLARVGVIAGVVGAIALFLGNVGSIRDDVSQWLRPGPKQAAVEVVATAFATLDSAAIPKADAAASVVPTETAVNLVATGLPASDTVDVTLLNVTGTTAVVSEATLTVREVVHVSFMQIVSPLIQRSATYDFYTPQQPTPYSISRAIAHDLKPNDADRIGFHLIGDPEDYFIIFDLTLKHSGHNSPTQGQPMMHYFRGFGRNVPTRAQYESAAGVPAPVAGQLQSVNAQQAQRVRQAFLNNENALQRLEASGATPSAQALEQLNILRRAHQH